MNILNGLESVTSIMQNCIRCENTPDGILSDVETIITVANNENGIDEPAIWINQHPTIVAPNTKSSLSGNITLQTAFEFVCIEYDPEPEVAEQKGQNLASRCVLAVLRNYQRLQKEYGERVISNVLFEMFYPTGDVSIEGKREKVPATSVVLNVQHKIDWLNCCKKIIKEEINDNNDNDGD